MVANNKTLIISNYMFEKLGCHALTSKAYISKDDDSKLYIKANSLLIEDVKGFIFPRSRCKIGERIDESINYSTLLDKIKQNGEIKVYPPFTIESLLGRVLLLTLWDGSDWYELICKTVEIVEDSEPAVRVCLYPDYPDCNNQPLLDDINKYAMSNLHLTSQLKEIPHEWDGKPYTVSYQRFVHFSTDLLYSIETKGKFEKREIDLPEKRFHHEGERSWEPNNILLSQMNLTISFDHKYIHGHYSDEEFFDSRRTSNGWIKRYLVKWASYGKSFELINDLQHFVDNMPKHIETIGGVLQVHDTYKKEEKTIEIVFKEPLTFEQINKVLQFNVNGSMYTYELD